MSKVVAFALSNAKSCIHNVLVRYQTISWHEGKETRQQYVDINQPVIIVSPYQECHSKLLCMKLSVLLNKLADMLIWCSPGTVVYFVTVHRLVKTRPARHLHGHNGQACWLLGIDAPLAGSQPYVHMPKKTSTGLSCLFQRCRERPPCWLSS